jgi:hypothetical protein
MAAEPSFVPPFSVEIDWEVVISGIRTKEAAVGEKGRLARRHPRSRVRVLDRHGEEVTTAPRRRAAAG